MKQEKYKYSSTEPKISKSLVDYLENIFFSKQYNKDVDIREVLVDIGNQEVVNHIRSLYQKQQEK